jgi:hypothetical protein
MFIIYESIVSSGDLTMLFIANCRCLTARRNDFHRNAYGGLIDRKGKEITVWKGERIREFDYRWGPLSLNLAKFPSKWSNTRFKINRASSLLGWHSARKTTAEMLRITTALHTTSTNSYICCVEAQILWWYLLVHAFIYSYCMVTENNSLGRLWIFQLQIFWLEVHNLNVLCGCSESQREFYQNQITFNWHYSICWIHR